MNWAPALSVDVRWSNMRLTKQNLQLWRARPSLIDNTHQTYWSCTNACLCPAASIPLVPNTDYQSATLKNHSSASLRIIRTTLTDTLDHIEVKQKKKASAPKIVCLICVPETQTVIWWFQLLIIYLFNFFFFFSVKCLNVTSPCWYEAVLRGLRDGSQVREGSTGGQKPTPRVSLLNVLEGHAGRATAAVLREEVLINRKTTLMSPGVEVSSM